MPTWSSNRLPEWMRSIRFRYTLLYSGVLFGLAALVIGAIYLILWISLHEPMSIINGRVIDRFSGQSFSVDIVTARQFERLVHQQTLERLRTFSFEALIVLFFASLVVGWVVAGRVLAPIARITGVAREIQATDLSRRIRLQGPNDELKQLADTFDAMLARIAAASHELRNPLAIIRTNADLALTDKDPQVDELRQAVVVVKRASDRMARLVDDLLALARRESPTFAIEQVDLGRAVTEASEEFLAPAEARGIVLDRAVAPGVVVMGDSDALKRAVANLLENAVRLAPAGSRIRLAVGSERGLAWIAVSDEGPGIATEHPPRVFDRFWRADKGRSRADGGTGLGLSIVRQIAQSHGGDVQLQSKLGVGSTFTIWLPVANVSSDPARSLTSGAPR